MPGFPGWTPFASNGQRSQATELWEAEVFGENANSCLIISAVNAELVIYVLGIVKCWMSFSFTGVNESRCAKTVVAVSLAPKQCWIWLWSTGWWAVRAWLHLHRWHTTWWEPPKGLAGSVTEDPASGVPSQCWQRCRVGSCHQIIGGRNGRTHVGREIAGEPAESGEQTRHEVSQREKKGFTVNNVAVWGAGSRGWAEAAVPLSPRSLLQAGVGACCTCMPGYSGAEVVPHADVLSWFLLVCLAERATDRHLRVVDVLSAGWVGCLLWQSTGGRVWPKGPASVSVCDWRKACCQLHSGKLVKNHALSPLPPALSAIPGGAEHWLVKIWGGCSLPPASRSWSRLEPTTTVECVPNSAISGQVWQTSTQRLSTSWEFVELFLFSQIRQMYRPTVSSARLLFSFSSSFLLLWCGAGGGGGVELVSWRSLTGRGYRAASCLLLSTRSSNRAGRRPALEWTPWTARRNTHIHTHHSPNCFLGTLRLGHCMLSVCALGRFGSGVSYCGSEVKLGTVDRRWLVDREGSRHCVWRRVGPSSFFPRRSLAQQGAGPLPSSTALTSFTSNAF